MNKKEIAEIYNDIRKLIGETKDINKRKELDVLRNEFTKIINKQALLLNKLNDYYMI